MPSWSIHLALAKRLKDKYHYSDNFVIGNIIPDVPLGYVIKNPLKPASYDATHYNPTKDQMPKCDINKFLAENINNLDNEIILGSYMHLLTDTYFNDYTSKYHLVSKGEHRYVLLNNGKVDHKRHPKEIKHHDFAIFANNLAYHKKVGNKVELLSNTEELISALPYEIDSHDLQNAIEEIERITKINTKDERPMEMFYPEELIGVFNSCYSFLDMQVEKLHNHGLINGGNNDIKKR